MIRLDPDDLPYGPGNPDYEYDGRVQRELEEADAAARQQGEHDHNEVPQGEQQ